MAACTWLSSPCAMGAVPFVVAFAGFLERAALVTGALTGSPCAMLAVTHGTSSPAGHEP